MKDEILKLANERGFKCSSDEWGFYDHQLEAFYRAAYNKAIEDAAEKADAELEGFASNADRDVVSDTIRSLEIK